MADWSSVTRREAEILDAVRQRLSNAEIAARFFISERTVESHVSSLLRKLHVGDRVELARLAPPSTAGQVAREGLPGQAEVLVAEPLVGRAEELDRLTALWSKAAGGLATLGIVTGEAGVGKSRLVAELAAGTHRDGARVLWSACYEDIQAPYQPLADALESQAEALASAAAADELGPSAAVLARMLGLRSESAAEPSVGAGELWLALRRCLRWITSTGPVLLVVEDLHWAADSTREAVLQLVRSADPIPLLVVGTARDTRPDLDAGGQEFLGRCELLANSERVALRGLDRRDVADLVAMLGSGADAEQLCADSGGNPLLVRELARSTGSRGSSLAALLAPRYRRLGTDVVEVLDAAAVLGATFDAVHISGVLDRPVMEVVQSLDEAEGAGLVVPIPDRPGRFAFVHPLFRTLHYDNLPTRTRLELHHHAALELERAAVDDRGVAALARHACIAAPVGDPRAAIRFARDAAAVAERVLALDEAVQHYRQALTVAELLPEERRLRLELATSLGRVLIQSADPSGRETLAEAAAWARKLGDGAALADIAWAAVPFGRAPTPGTTDPEFVAFAEDALALLGEEPSAARVRVLAALSTQLVTGGEPERGHRCAAESLAIARGLDDPRILGVALIPQRLAGGLPQRPEARLEIADELLDLGERLREPTFFLNGLYDRVWALRELGYLAAHDRALDTLEAALVEHPTSFFKVTVLLFRAMQHLLRGDLDAAQEVIGEAFVLAPEAGHDPVGICGPVLLAIANARGEIGTLAPAIEERVEQWPGLSAPYEALLAVSYARAGRVQEASRIVQTTAADGFTSVQRNMAYTTSLALLAEAVELTGEAAAATQLLDLLAPFSGLAVDNSTSVFETIDLAIAKAALAAGNVDEARTSAARVLASEMGRGAPMIRGRALIRLAAAERAGAGSAHAAEALVGEALQIAHDTGAAVIEQDAEHYGLLPT